MVDSVLLLVDAVEGPMPQTRFVTRKALALGLKPIVVVNKVDRPGARPTGWSTTRSISSTSSARPKSSSTSRSSTPRRSKAGRPTDLAKKSDNLKPLFDAILKHVPVREDDPDGPLQLQICSLDYSSYVGRIGIGRIKRGRIRPASRWSVLHGPDSTPVKRQGQPGAGVQGPRARAWSKKRRPATSC